MYTGKVGQIYEFIATIRLQVIASTKQMLESCILKGQMQCLNATNDLQVLVLKED